MVYRESPIVAGWMLSWACSVRITLEPVACKTAHKAELVLPGTLGEMDDGALITVCELIISRVVELESTLDLAGHRVRPVSGGRHAFAHVIDLAFADPYGQIPVE